MFYGLLAEQVDAAASRAATSSGFESLGAHQWCRQGSVSESDRLRCIQIGCELVTHGDVAEMGDTLVLETSAFARESSNLSIPTKDFKETWPSGRRHRTANAESSRKAPSVQIGSSPPALHAAAARCSFAETL